MTNDSGKNPSPMTFRLRARRLWNSRSEQRVMISVLLPKAFRGRFLAFRDGRKGDLVMSAHFGGFFNRLLAWSGVGKGLKADGSENRLEGNVKGGWRCFKEWKLSFWSEFGGGNELRSRCDLIWTFSVLFNLVTFWLNFKEMWKFVLKLSGQFQAFLRWFLFTISLFKREFCHWAFEDRIQALAAFSSQILHVFDPKFES